MVDPVTIISGIALANKAFKEVKQLLENGKSVNDCAKQLTDWATGCSQVHEENNKQKLMGSSTSASAMERLLSVQKIQKQREELREFLQLYGTPGSWNLFLQYEREARLELKKAKEDMARKRANRLNKMKNIFVVFLAFMFFALLAAIGALIYLNI